MNLPALIYKKVYVQEINLTEHPYSRIEIGWSLHVGNFIKNFYKALRNHYKDFQIKTVEEFKHPLWRKMFLKETLMDYFNYHKVPISNIEYFFKHIFQPGDEEIKISTFNERSMNILNMFILIQTSSRILINTKGWGVSHLLFAYQILKDHPHISCIEVTYPQYEENHGLTYMVPNVNRIMVGKMVLGGIKM